LIGVAGKDVSGDNDSGGVDSARDGIRDIKARANVMARADITITT
jgi:hypothetical protein